MSFQSNTPKITVIDSLMGKGKSTAAISYINENPDKNFVVVLPTRSECLRYADALDRDAVVPHTETSTGKETLLTVFNEAVAQGKSVITTHALLKRWDDMSIRELRGKDYTLILDEVLDVVEPFRITSKDYHTLIAGGVVSEEVDTVTGLKRVILQDGDYLGKHESFIQQVARGNMVRVRDDFCIWLTGPQRLLAFDEVFILTYNFQGSVMAAWLKLNKLSYEMKSVENGQFSDYKPESGYSFRHLIDIVQDSSLNSAWKRNNALSVNGLKKARSERMKRLKNDIRKFYDRHGATNPHFNMWTCPQEFKPKLQRSPFGYIGGRVSQNQLRRMSAEERVMRDTHVAVNMRATNLYRHKKYLAYAYNVFPNPALTKLFHECGIPFDQDQYALNEFVQWIWRSRVRVSEKVSVYVPSKRMRDLLTNWLNTDNTLELKEVCQAV
ncbi:MAG: hypothetical protein N0C84_03360 [Candidatus Thiodiazotropha taylori]|uniref:Uncharacterized protein n=1 Tax=Candidatus Thiodiazotropha taylori TaxID=2792791 RepID=A0A9E4KAG8_9GAMM|nr:hypothetical protein [Candidatus Thiodiazotropha taylori]MCW4255486.1 hypothetical protein [Candidatus Thiodiazotropha taylori]